VFDEQTLIIGGAVLVMAGLYSMVGHGGGSGYLAVLAITGLLPEQMRTTALLLNVVVATIGTWRFGNAGAFRKDLFIPLVCTSIPASFVGGLLDLPSTIYKPIVGIILLYAAIRLFIPIKGSEQTKHPALFTLLSMGVLIGVPSGIIGVGGGIFLSPLILLLGFATAKQTAAITAPFILVNSIAGLAGISAQHGTLPVTFTFVAPLIIAVVIGGFAGATFGSRRLGHQGLRTVLGLVLFVAAAKMFITTNSQQSTRAVVDVKSTL
jgi:hypothetical protein